MGGAERNARKKKQQSTQAARAVAAARGSGAERNKIIVGLVVVVVLAAIVIGGVIWSKKSDNTAQASTNIPTKTLSVNYPVQRQDAVVIAGKDSAKVTLDFYEDFICPGCGAFEKKYSDTVEKALEAGTIKVRYNMLPMLDRMSNPPGYSTRAANAGLCAADAGQFPNFHASLYASQPKEQSAGYDNGKLAQLGKDLGINAASWESCVNNGTYQSALSKHLNDTISNPSLQQDDGNGGKSFFTPTIVANGKIVDVQNPSWLDDLVKAAA